MKEFIYVAFALMTATSAAETIGELPTTLNLFGKPNHIRIEAFEDPLVPGVTCYVSRPKVGGLAGALNLAEEASESSTDCRQLGPIRKEHLDAIKAVERTDHHRDRYDLMEDRDVFRAELSPFFKVLRVVRFYDEKRRVIIYVSFVRGLADGSRKSSLSIVPIQ